MPMTDGTSTALVFGTTGMLLHATLNLAKRRQRVISFSRKKKNPYLPKNVVCVPVDFGSPDALQKIMGSIHNQAEIFEVLIWMHSEFHPLVKSLLEQLVSLNPKIIVQVFGSSSSKNAITPEQFSRHAHNKVKYHWVKLGSLDRRWLTHKEISEGALNALSARIDVVVGNL